MDHPHRIEDAVFDLRFSAEEEAFEQQATLGSFINNQLMPVVDQVFTEMSGTDAVVRIDRLEIDLGTIPYHSFQDEMPQRLATRLRDALREKLPVPQAEAAQSSEVISRSQLELEQLQYFLLNGHLPWNADLDDEQTIAHMFHRVLHVNGSELAAFLSRSPHQETLIKRLVNQFAADKLAALVQWLAPSQAHYLSELADDLRRLRRSHLFGPATESELKNSVWQPLITELLKTDGTFNRRQLTGQIVEQILQHHGHDDSHLLSMLTHEAAQRGTWDIRTPELHSILRNALITAQDRQQNVPQVTPQNVQRPSLPHNADPTDAKMAAPIDPDEGKPTNIQHLRGRLAAAMRAGKVTEIRDIWPILLQDHPELVQQTFKHDARLASVRRTISSGFPASMRRDLVALFKPEGHGFIHQLMEQPVLFRQALGESAEETDDLESRLWEFTFAYLLVQQSRELSKSDYIGSLVHQVADYYRLGYHDLLRSLNSVVTSIRDVPPPTEQKHHTQDVESRLIRDGATIRDKVEHGGRLKSTSSESAPDRRSEHLEPSDVQLKELHDAVTDLMADNTVEPHSFDDAESPSDALIHAYERYERLRRHLLHGEAATQPGHGDLSQLIDDLTRQHPEFMLRLYREMQAGEIDPATAATVLSSHELEQLIRAFIRLTQPAAADEPVDLLQAIDAYAEQVTDTRYYYGQVLTCLIEDRVIDFDAITAHNQSREADGWHANQDVESRPIRDGATIQGTAEHGDNLKSTSSESASDRRSEHLEPSEARLKELHDAVSDLTAENTTAPHSPDDAESPSSSLIYAYERYEQLRQHLLHDRVASQHRHADLRQLIDDLARQHPEFMLRLYREMQAGEIDPATAATVLSSHEIERLIRAFIRLTQPAAADEPVDLLQAIDAYAEQVADTRYYYGQVLTCLIEDRVIDFDAITAGSQSGHQQRQSAGLPSTSAAAAGVELPWEETEAALTNYLETDDLSSIDDAAPPRQALERLLTRQSARLRQLLESIPDRRKTAARLIDLLPEQLLTRVLFLLRPQAHHQMQSCADLLGTACYSSELGVTPGQIRQLKWRFIFRYAFEEALPFRLATFVQDFVHNVVRETRGLDAATTRARLRQRLARNILPANQQQHVAIMAALSQPTEDTPRPAPGWQEPVRFDVADRVAETERESAAALYIANAGLVLAAPYLPRLFNTLELTGASGFKDQQAAERAVHLLQFMVDERTNSPEYQLVLNKLLCGVETGVPITREIIISDREKDTIEGLIQGMIHNWRSIGNTSIAGLRESFLQREGRLQLEDDAWHLRVEARSFDMLLDQLPWSFAIIKHPWMERVLHVDWR